MVAKKALLIVFLVIVAAWLSAVPVLAADVPTAHELLSSTTQQTREGLQDTFFFDNHLYAVYADSVANRIVIKKYDLSGALKETYQLIGNTSYSITGVVRAAANENGAWIIWREHDDIGGNDYLYSAYSSDGTNFNESLVDSDLAIYFADIACAGDAAFVVYGASNGYVYAKRTDNGGASYSPAYTVLQVDSFSQLIQVAAASASDASKVGAAFVYRYHYVDSGGGDVYQTKIYYSETPSSSNSWTTEEIVSNESICPDENAISTVIDVAFDDTGRPWVAWASREDTKIYYMLKSGTSWTSPAYFSSSNTLDTSLKLVFNPVLNSPGLMITYTKGASSGLFYRYASSASFGAEKSYFTSGVSKFHSSTPFYGHVASVYVASNDSLQFAFEEILKPGETGKLRYELWEEDFEGFSLNLTDDPRWSVTVDAGKTDTKFGVTSSYKYAGSKSMWCAAVKNGSANTTGKYDPNMATNANLNVDGSNMVSMELEYYYALYKEDAGDQATSGINELLSLTKTGSNTWIIKNLVRNGSYNLVKFRFVSDITAVSSGYHGLVVDNLKVYGYMLERPTLNVEQPVSISESLYEVNMSASCPGATNYSFYRATSSVGPYSLVGTSASGNFTDTIGDDQGETQGNYYYLVIADDGVYESPRSSYSSISINTPPVIVLTGVTDGAYYNNDVTPVFYASDPEGCTWTATLNGSPFVSGTTISSDGDYNLIIVATDNSGFTSTKTASFTIDKTPPSISVSGVSDGSYYPSPVTITYSVSDANLDTQSATLDGNPFSSGNTVSSEGQHTLHIEATDKAGNNRVVDITFTIDMTAPSIVFNNIVEGGSYNPPFVPDIDIIDDSPTTYDATLNGSPYILGTSIDTTGSYTLVINVTDAAGNLSSETRHFNLVDYDVSPPSVIFSGFTDGGYYNIDIDPVVTVSDVSGVDYYTVDVYRNGSYIGPLSGPYSQEGIYLIEVYAVDNLGNDTTATASFTIDKTPPSIAVSGVLNGNTYNDPVTPLITVTDNNLDTKTITLNGSPFVSGTKIDTAGDYTLHVEATDKAGNASVKDVAFTLILDKRVEGRTRIDTAIELSKDTFDQAQVVVIATAYNFPDALSAAPLAHAVNAPILLTDKSKLPSAVADEIMRLGADTAYIIGGEAAVGPEVELALQALGLNVIRVGGKDRFSTAVLVANELAKALNKTHFDRVYIATGMNYPDALAAGGIAAADGSPILLVKADWAPQSVYEFINNYNVSETIVVGGPSVISDAIMNTFPNTARLYGRTRFDTGIAVVNHAVTNLGFNTTTIYIATGLNYPDALAAGAVVAKTRCPMILVPTTSLYKYQSIIDFLDSHPEIRNVKVVGGENAVPQAIVEEVLSYI